MTTHILIVNDRETGRAVHVPYLSEGRAELEAARCWAWAGVRGYDPDRIVTHVTQRVASFDLLPVDSRAGSILNALGLPRRPIPARSNV